jgi:hypothetical protein
MRKVLIAVCLALFAQAAQAVPAWVKSGSWSVSTAGGITPTNAGDTLLIPIYCQGSGTIGTPTDSSGATPVLDFSTSHWAFYRETSVTTAARALTFTSTGCTTARYLMVEASGLGSFDKNAAEATGTGTPVTSNSLTPSANNEFLLGAVVTSSGSITFSTWTNSFTQDKTFGTGPSAADAYFVQTSGPTSINVGTTLSASETWFAVLAAYGPGAACTHSGITSAGAIAVPNGSSGSYRLKNGSFGTPDCATVNYMQPTLGNFGVN